MGSKKIRSVAVAAVAVAVSGAMLVVEAPMASASTGTQVSVQSQLAGPQVRVTDGYMTSADWLGTKIYVKVNAVSHPKGVVVIAHGVGEHSGRFDYMTAKYNAAGYTVYRMDHRGHGRSTRPYVDNMIPRGDVDNFASLVGDIKMVVDRAHAENMGSKVFLFGHSMGAFAAQYFGEKYPGAVDGIVTNGGGIPLNLNGANNLNPTEVTAEGLTAAERYAFPTISQIVPLADLTSFNAQLLAQALRDPASVSYNSPLLLQSIWVENAISVGLCTDPRVVIDYKKDPLVAKRMYVSTVLQMGAAEVYNMVNADKFTGPTLIMHGKADGVVPSYFDQDWYNAIPSKDKQFILWKGLMHETHNEPVKDQVIGTVVDWLNQHVENGSQNQQLVQER